MHAVKHIERLRGCCKHLLSQTTHTPHTHTHPFSGLFSRKTWASWYQKGETSLDLNEARDDGVFGMQWLQLDHVQTICTSLQTDIISNKNVAIRQHRHAYRGVGTAGALSSAMLKPL